MWLYKSLIRPVLFKCFEPERAHDLAIRALRLLPIRRKNLDQALSIRVAGLVFPSPVGLAAGFDKDCRSIKQLYRFGFGSVEAGTVTPQRQDGNERPRIFRLPEVDALINRMGFPNDGLETISGRLKKLPNELPAPLGINIGANKDSDDRVFDYVFSLRKLSRFADYITINVSSPNTPGLRTLESGEELSRLLKAIDAFLLSDNEIRPVFLKVSPDLDEPQIADISRQVLGSLVSGIIVGNTTISRPTEIDQCALGREAGGLSGRPLKDVSFKSLTLFRKYLGADRPIISVGGISTAEDVYARIKSGASLVQIYTAFIYEGWDVVDNINSNLLSLLHADGFSCLQDAIGANENCSRLKMHSDYSEHYVPTRALA